ncbi:hypothetical protein EJK55_0704 [Moraxella catarrhalis]|uniref:Uncharacterized protein n=1 Tax=Moraxella catarrhalis TaxID=480 RepID=A0A3S9QDE5_MORCA|nr:hypothetical protein MCR_0065 [Moraxella catarrhalis BBH18]AZQ88003.1 hypothetical protein EJK52_0068 [Moraxella catarrhalis]AZQ92606.1 hypothetical protein EJK53_0069 [Moraxella catarrhalis]AZQ94754.1 hypothetical protein EJK48_0068 [Moraxella catarrhalis]RUO14143.1 hypothetical protein EJK49_1268 [Moraxella catarrhalis]
MASNFQSLTLFVTINSRICEVFFGKISEILHKVWDFVCNY